MGGWVTLVGDISDFETRLTRFKRVFAVCGVPDLRTDAIEEDGIARILWAWKPLPIPDVYTQISDRYIMIMCGVVTDMGHLGPIKCNGADTARRLLQAWVTEGMNLIPQLNGSFSLIIFDRHERSTFFCVDRFASRSVWFVQEAGSWVIGNFPSAIASVMKDSPELDPAGLWSFFYAGRHVGSNGLYYGMKNLAAGMHAIINCDGTIKTSRWWQRKYRPEEGITPIEWGRRLAATLRQSAKRYRCVSQNPHLFLSGGLDSRMAAAALRSPLKTITLCTAPNAESRSAALVSRSLQVKHSIIIRSPYWYLDTADPAALISAGCYLSHHAHFMAPVQEIVREEPEAEFSLGDLMENFSKHYFHASQKDDLRFNPEKLVDSLFNHIPYTVREPLRKGVIFNSNISPQLQRVYAEALSAYAERILEVSESDADRFDTILRWADVSLTPTYNMITCVWPLSAERNLCLDNDVNDLSLKIPATLRGKSVLHRCALYHLHWKLLLIPDANTFMPPVVPKKLNALAKRIRPFLGKIRREVFTSESTGPKLQTSGSWLLLHELYRKDPSYKETIQDLLFDANLFPAELFDRSAIRRTWEQYLAGDITLHNEIEALRSFGSLQRLIPCHSIRI